MFDNRIYLNGGGKGVGKTPASYDFFIKEQIRIKEEVESSKRLEERRIKEEADLKETNEKIKELKTIQKAQEEKRLAQQRDIRDKESQIKLFQDRIEKEKDYTNSRYQQMVIKEKELEGIRIDPRLSENQPSAINQDDLLQHAILHSQYLLQKQEIERLNLLLLECENNLKRYISDDEDSYHYYKYLKYKKKYYHLIFSLSHSSK